MIWSFWPLKNIAFFTRNNIVAEWACYPQIYPYNRAVARTLTMGRGYGYGLVLNFNCNCPCEWLETKLNIIHRFLYEMIVEVFIYAYPCITPYLLKGNVTFFASVLPITKMWLWKSFKFVPRLKLNTIYVICYCCGYNRNSRVNRIYYTWPCIFPNFQKGLSSFLKKVTIFLKYLFQLSEEKLRW